MTIAWVLVFQAFSQEATSATSPELGPGVYPAIPAPIRTENPRRTIEAFIALRDEMIAAHADYRAERSLRNFNTLVDAARRLGSVVDTTSVPDALRGEARLDTAVALLDVFDRLMLPDPSQAPVDTTPETVHVLPGTPFQIARVNEGPRLGEFLFSPETIAVAPRIRDGLRAVPPRTSRDFASWSNEISSVTGPLFPESWENTFSDWGSTVVLDTPLRKHVLLFVILAVIAITITVIHRLLRAKESTKGLSSPVRKLATPSLIIATVLLVEPIVDEQLNVFGRLDQAMESLKVVALYVAAAWAAWLACITSSELAIRRPGVKEHSLDASLLRLSARVIGIIVSVVIIAMGLQALGLPVFSLLAGLGIGGLAVALAIRPSLENLVGGFILYLDQPIRVGDFCQVGDLVGTIEKIGARSTQLRALNRTLISIPNAQFADMQIVNWAKCDQMLLEHEIGLRYETSQDQLRWALSKIRLMFHAHPRIDSDTVRVRFAGYGESALTIEIRVYVLSREWNDFFAVREDVLLRVGEIVSKSGSGFAFPSRTIYTATDGGLDEERGDRAAEQVARWRRTGQLPFPRFASENIERVNDRLAYPPYGSPHFTAGSSSEDELWEATSEPLSLETEPEDEEAVGEGTSEKRTPSE